LFVLITIFCILDTHIPQDYPQKNPQNSCYQQSYPHYPQGLAYK
jgi:hypothetical protein